MTEHDELLQAAKHGSLDAVTRLVAHDPASASARASSGETPLMAALYRGHHAVVDALVQAGAELDIFAGSALGKLAAVEGELERDPSRIGAFAYDGWTPLHLAAFFGRRAVAQQLITRGADLGAVSGNSLRNTPLHAAVAGGHVDVALFLIAQGASVNAADAGGHTPLHIAAEAGYVPIVKALLERGADPHAVDAEDRTPLSRAVTRQHTEIVDLINLSE